jgi:hypothetical protein
MPMDRAAAALGQLLAGDALAQPVAVIARLGIPDLLAAGPRSTADLAQATASHPDALGRVLRALAAMGVLGQPAPGVFALTPLSDLLRRDVAGSMHATAKLAASPWRVAAHHLLHTVRTGQPAFEHLYGTTLYEHLAQHPDEGALFDAIQAAHGPSIALERACQIEGAAAIVDVGGGLGARLASLLRALPDARGVLLERAPVIERARAALQVPELEGRCELVAGDFFERVPPGGDVYLLGFVLHNWDDERAARILGRCRAAMAPGARLLVIENVLPETGDAGFGALLDLEMLIYSSGGRERTERELRALLENADFSLVRTTPTETSASILTALPRPSDQRVIAGPTGT